MTESSPFATRRRLLSAGALGAAMIAAPNVFAQARGRTTTIVVPFSPGGSIDVAVRIVAPELERALKQTVIVDNKPGASAIIGASYAARRPADGSTILVGSNSSLVNNVALFDKLPYDPTRDFRAVTMLGRSTLLVSAKPGAPFANAREMVAYAREHPDGITRGSSGIGNVTNIAMLRLERTQGIRMIHVPHASEAQSMPSLLGGNIDIQVGAVSGSTLAYIQSQRIKPIVSMGPARNPKLPGVETVDEAGLTGAYGMSWFVFAVPAATPTETVSELNRALNAAMGAGDIRERILSAGLEPMGGTAEDAEKHIAAERQIWIPFIRSAGIKE